jgi:phosphoglycolate phosphatase-like HAD superfamily hydrolase
MQSVPLEMKGYLFLFAVVTIGCRASLSRILRNAPQLRLKTQLKKVILTLEVNDLNILWDFDGTLFNTYPAYTKILANFTSHGITEEEAFPQLKVSFNHAFRYFGLSAEEEKEVRAAVRKLMPEDFLPFPGVKEVLARADKNVIMTHKEREDVEKVLKYHALDGFFAEIVAGDDGYPRKPHTASYEFLHNKHHIDLVIGDRELDVIPGKQLGIQTCLFQNQAGSADFHLEKYADFEKTIGKTLK